MDKWFIGWWRCHEAAVIMEWVPLRVLEGLRFLGVNTAAINLYTSMGFRIERAFELSRTKEVVIKELILMEDTFVIDSITNEDLSQLSRLYEELDESKSSINKMTEQFQFLSSNPDYIFMGAKNNDGELVGSVMGVICFDLTGACRPFMIIENMIVTNRYQRIGVGRLIMASIELKAKERNCHCIILVSGIKRKGAHEFYESLGYNRSIIHGFVKNLS